MFSAEQVSKFAFFGESMGKNDIPVVITGYLSKYSIDFSLEKEIGACSAFSRQTCLIQFSNKKLV